MASDLTLRLWMGSTVDLAPREVVEALMQARVTEAAKGASGFDLTFATSTKSPITQQMLPSGYFDPPARVVLEVILRSSTVVLIDGVITHQEVVPSDEAGKSVLSVKGEDLTRMMDLEDRTGLEFPAQPPERRVEKILTAYTSTYGITPKVTKSGLLVVPPKEEKIPHQRGTDLAYIKALADRAGYVFFLQPGQQAGKSMAYWGPMLRVPDLFPAPPPLVIDWDGRSNVESLQFSFDGFAKTTFKGLIQAAGDQNPVPVNQPGIPALINPPLGQKVPEPLKKAPLTGLAKYQSAEAASIALARELDAANVVTGQGTLDVLRYGVILPSRTIVWVRGAGITYDGEYFVESVTHTIKPGSYKQSFTLSRNALIARSGAAGGVSTLLGTPVQQLGALAGWQDVSAGRAAAVTQTPGPATGGGSAVEPSLPASPSA